MSHVYGSGKSQVKLRLRRLNGNVSEAVSLSRAPRSLLTMCDLYTKHVRTHDIHLLVICCACVALPVQPHAHEQVLPARPAWTPFLFPEERPGQASVGPSRTFKDISKTWQVDHVECYLWMIPNTRAFWSSVAKLLASRPVAHMQPTSPLKASSCASQTQGIGITFPSSPTCL